MATTYMLLTQHGPERKVRRKRFPDFDSAKAFADAHDPDAEPTTCPNLDQDLIDYLGDRYEQGQFWFGNRWGVIYKVSK